MREKGRIKLGLETRREEEIIDPEAIAALIPRLKT